jgi:hypothetical protein
MFIGGAQAESRVSCGAGAYWVGLRGAAVAGMALSVRRGGTEHGVGNVLGSCWQGACESGSGESAGAKHSSGDSGTQLGAER